MRPRGPGKPNYMPPDKVRAKVLEALPVQLPHAASTMRAQAQHPLAAAGLPEETLEQVLLAARHLPADGLPKT